MDAKDLYSACIANAMIIVYTLRQIGDNADVSYSVSWLGLWACAEIGLGIIVICALSLPKFMKSRGQKLRLFFVSIIRPFSPRSSSLFSLRTLRKSTTDAKTQSRDVDVEGLSTLGVGAQHAAFPLETYLSEGREDHQTSPHRVHTGDSLQ